MRYRLDSDENGARGPAARVPAVRRGQTQGRPGTRRAMPKLATATEHDAQPLPDVQVNSFAAVRLGHRDFPVLSAGV